MTEIMQPGDYISFGDIQGPEHLERIRKGVRAMGWKPVDHYGTRFGNVYLKINSTGVLVWSNYPGNNYRWHPDEVIAWAERKEDPPHGDAHPKRNTEAVTWLEEFADRIKSKDERWWEDYEFWDGAAGWKSIQYLTSAVILAVQEFTLRRAPRMIELGGVRFKAPETEAPEYGTNYYSPDHDAICDFRVVIWDHCKTDHDRLERGRVHLDAENAALHAQAEREAIQQQMGGRDDR